MNRDYRKKKLRQRILKAGNSSSSKPNKNNNVIVRRLYSRIHWRRMVTLIVLLVLGTFTWFYYQRNYMFTSYKTIWEKGISEGSLVRYEKFGVNVLKVTKDGASYIDDKGNNTWTVSYEMKNPTVSVKGDYAAIADMKGNSIYIFSSNGLMGIATTTLPISKVEVSGIGIVAAILEDSTFSYICFFHKDGSDFDLTITTSIIKSGYPLDIAISSDGTQLMASYVFIQNGGFKNRVVFYDFSEIGKSIEGRLVGGFEEPFQGSLVGAVHFLGGSYSCAFSTNGLSFFSTRILTSPVLVEQVLLEEEIQSVFYSDDYVGIIVKNNSGDFSNRLEIYKKSGEPVMKKNFTYDYKEVDIDGDLVILHNQDSCMIYNMAGVLKLNASFDSTVLRIRIGNSPNTLILIGPQIMKKIKLH